MAIFRKARSGEKHAEPEHEKAATQPERESPERAEDPLHDAHVDVPRWRPPISATPDEDESIESDEDAGDEDDTLEFERPLI